MSKLSESLKALISASHARPGYTRPPTNLKPFFHQLALDAQHHNVGLPAWLTISTAASMTLNCPEAMTQLFSVTQDLLQPTATTTTISPSPTDLSAVKIAELMREVGLKCISFNGIPRTINCLGAFHSSLPSSVTSSLSTVPTRTYTPQNISSRLSDGLALWDSVYAGFERKLIQKLAQSHPDLPVHILTSHYGNLLSDPPGATPGGVGRVLTSLVAITCLRCQTGVGPQVTSHVFGLRKAYELGHAAATTTNTTSEQNKSTTTHDGGEVAEEKGEGIVEGGEWLASDEGNKWILETIDRIVRAVVPGEEGTTFAPGFRPKL